MHTPKNKEEALREIVQTASRHTVRSNAIEFPDVAFSELSTNELLGVIHDFENHYNGWVTGNAQLSYYAAKLLFVARMIYDEKENT